MFYLSFRESFCKFITCTLGREEQHKQMVGDSYFFSSLLQATGKKKVTPGGSLDQALERMCNRTRELRGQVKEKFEIQWQFFFLVVVRILIIMV